VCESGKEVVGGGGEVDSGGHQEQNTRVHLSGVGGQV